jgi:hypothetical protein
VDTLNTAILIVGLFVVFLLGLLIGIGLGEGVGEKIGVIEAIRGATVIENMVVVKDFNNPEKTKAIELNENHLKFLKKTEKKENSTKEE